MLALVAGPPAYAQQLYRPPAGPPAAYGTPYPSQVQPFPAGPAPASGVAGGGGQLAPAQPGSPSSQVRGTNAGLPAGYRPVAGSRQDPPAPADRLTPGGAGGGKVMYFHKAADAVAPDGPPDAGAVAMAAAADLPAGPGGVPDVPVPVPGIVPPPARAAVADRPIPVPEVVYTPPVLPAPLPANPTIARPPAAAQQPMPGQPFPQPVPGTKSPDFKAPVPKDVTELPRPSQVFLMLNDTKLEQAILENIAERLKKKPQDLTPFPPLPAVAPPGVEYTPKTAALPPGKMVYEPTFVIHRRLHFEEKNAERYGWDFGFVQPFVSTVSFYKNALLWPNSLASGLEVGFWDTSAGKCLPGSPTPYYLYPPGLTITGVLTEAGLITGTVAITHPAHLLTGAVAP